MWPEAEGGGPGAKDRLVPHGENRRYRVKAIDQDGLESDWSEVAEGQAKPLPDPPQSLTVEYADEEARVTWEKPEQPDVEGYTVWKKKMFGWELLGEVDDLLPDRAGLGHQEQFLELLSRP